MQKVQIEYWICRLCGFIYKGKTPPICPACGAPATSFVPYKMGADEKRLRILRMDFHPIATHFAVGGAVILTVIFFVAKFFPTVFGVNLSYGGVLDFFVIWQPIFTVGTLLLGLVDGKLRYKKYQTRYLRQKIFLGIMMLASSLLVVIFHFTSAAGTIPALWVLELIFVLCTLGFAGMLGLIGGQLTCNIVPRGKELEGKPVPHPAVEATGESSEEEN